MDLSIYADNAATTPMDPEALRSMHQCIVDVYANPAQPYSTARKAREILEQSRETIADCIGADPAEIYFTSGGSESNNWAVKGSYKPLGCRHTILTTPIEHHSVLNSCHSMEKVGENVHFMTVNIRGLVECAKLAELLDPSVRLVSSMWANNEIGTIEPIGEIASLSHENGSVVHTDAVQAVGHVPIDVHRSGVDFLSASAHKFNGPHGIGFLYIRDGTDLQPLIDGGSQERGHRAGTQNVPAAYAMSIALKNNCSSLRHNQDHLRNLERTFFSILDETGVDYVRNGDLNHLPGLINVSFKDMGGEALLHRLDLKGIQVSTGSACDGSSNVASHVLQAIQVDPDYIDGTIRVSFGKQNTDDDARAVSGSICDIINQKIEMRRTPDPVAVLPLQGIYDVILC